MLSARSTRLSVPMTMALATSVTLGWAPASASDFDSTRIQTAHQNPYDWLTYHGTYKPYHYSALDQINTRNI